MALPAGGNLPGGNLRAIGVASFSVLNPLNSTTGMQVFAWFVIGAGGKGYFFAAIPRRDFDTSRLCREFVVVGFAQFESRVSS